MNSSFLKVSHFFCLKIESAFLVKCCYIFTGGYAFLSRFALHYKTAPYLRRAIHVATWLATHQLVLSPASEQAVTNLLASVTRRNENSGQSSY